MHSLVYGMTEVEEEKVQTFLKRKFAVTMSTFCGDTGTVCFGLQLISPMGFKARLDAPSPMLSVTQNQL